jgi:glycosyltransferase involved in cell wall biosynthesis
LRIGIVAPPWYPIPPQGYGGIEWMIYWLAEGLVARGHEVTVIGAGGSQTSANFIPTYEDPPFKRIGESLPEVLHALAAAEALDDLRVDVVHDHCLAGPLTAARRRVPSVLTAHGPLDGEVRRYYEMLSDSLSLVAISDCQRRKAPGLRWAGMVHNAVPVDEYPFKSRKEDFCLFLGRMNAEKAPELAIEAARRAGYPIVVAAKCNEPPEKRYFEEHVRPLLGPDAHWFGEANTAQKKDLLARARCLVFPIQWDEPFGIVMVEAMACGTPVVALRRGSVPEVVEDGVTGFICDDLGELPWAIVKVDELEPKLCRQHVAEQFDVSNMVEGYEAIYRGVARTPSHERWRIHPAPSSERMTS